MIWLSVQCVHTPEAVVLWCHGSRRFVGTFWHARHGSVWSLSRYCPIRVQHDAHELASKSPFLSRFWRTKLYYVWHLWTQHDSVGGLLALKWRQPEAYGTRIAPAHFDFGYLLEACRYGLARYWHHGGYWWGIFEGLFVGCHPLWHSNFSKGARLPNAPYHTLCVVFWIESPLHQVSEVAP